MKSTSRSTLSGVLLRLCLAAGAVPLGLQFFFWVRSSRTAGLSSAAGIEAVWIVAAVSGLALVVTAWALVNRFEKALGKTVLAVRGTVTRITDNDFGARAEITGPGSELSAFGDGLNALLERQQSDVLNLRLEVKQAVALRESSRRLIEECIYARQPLAKQHPGLAAAYAAAAMRQAGQVDIGENQTVEGLVHEVESGVHRSGNRENLRWTLKDMRIEVPMPSQLVNMSVGGMAVESNRGLPVGGSWVFRIGNEAFSYDIPGKICWCRLERTVKVDEEIRPVYRTGVEFDDRLSGKAFDFFSPAALDAGLAQSALM